MATTNRIPFKCLTSDHISFNNAHSLCFHILRHRAVGYILIYNQFKLSRQRFGENCLSLLVIQTVAVINGDECRGCLHKQRSSSSIQVTWSTKQNVPTDYMYFFDIRSRQLFNTCPDNRHVQLLHMFSFRRFCLSEGKQRKHSFYIFAMQTSCTKPLLTGCNCFGTLCSPSLQFPGDIPVSQCLYHAGATSQ